MKNNLSKITGILLLAGAIILSFSKNVLAENAVFTPNSPSDEQLSNVVYNCSNIQNQLSKVHSTDALKRVNLGQSYETISNDLMANLNARIALNSLNGSELVKFAAEFSENIQYFRENYKIYEQELKKLKSTDCSKSENAREFYYQLEKVRYQRRELNYNVSVLQGIAEKYKTAITDFEKGLK